MTRRSSDDGGVATAERPARLPTIDPRMQQRRVEVKRAEGRRRLRLLLIILSVVLVLTSAWAVTRSPLLDVDRIIVRGAQYTTAAEVASAAHVSHGAYMTAIDEHASARRIEQLPWVEHAHVIRRWPRTLVVTIRERRPAVSTPASGGGWALLDRTGRVLVGVANPNPDRPVLEGVEPVGGPGTHLGPASRPALEVAAALPPSLVGRISVVRRTGDEVELVLRPEGIVRLGTTERLSEKLATVETLLARIDLQRLAVLDVRAPASPTVVRTGEPAAPVPAPPPTRPPRPTPSSASPRVGTSSSTSVPPSTSVPSSTTTSVPAPAPGAESPKP